MSQIYKKVQNKIRWLLNVPPHYLLGNMQEKKQKKKNKTKKIREIKAKERKRNIFKFLHFSFFFLAL